MGAATVETGPSRTSPPPERPSASPPGRRRAILWGIVALWVGLLAIAAPLGGKVGDVESNETIDYLPESADSTQVVELQERLPGGETTELILVYERDGGLTDADREAARAQVDGIAARYEIAGDTTPQGIPSADGTTEMYPVTITGIADPEERVEAVRDVREDVDEGLPDGLTVMVGGSGGLALDNDEVFASVDGTLMMTTAAIVAVLLILTYRSPMLWLLPLLCVGVAVMASRALVYGLVEMFDVTVNGMNLAVMSVLVFGAGTDYALLLVARYREELRRHERPYDAMVRAVRGCGPALLASAATVSAGLLCLMAADLNSTAGLGPVGVAGIVCSLLVMLTLLPTLLVMCGRRVFWPFVPAHGSEGTDAKRGYFARVGGSITRRPVAILAGGLALMGALALGNFNMPGPLSSEDSFVDTPESIAAMEQLGEAYPEQSAQPIAVMAHSDQADAVLDVARATEGVADVQTGRSGDGWTEISVYATDPPESDGEKSTIETLREDLAAVDGAEAVVGGSTAEQLDLASTNADDRTLVIPLVLGAVLLILIALLRSVTAPVILLAAVVASWGAAMGLGGLLFSSVFGFEGVDQSMAVITFVFGVALGVDYGIFLMHRMREENLNGLETRQAALTALRTTGGVIASAGIVLAATFAVLMSMPMVMMIEIGFIVAIGVLLDTFLVRTYIVTAASWLLGRRVWSPGPLSRTSASPESGSPEPISHKSGAGAG
ncbi:MMPL family transporter [Streptomyces johnsoniae]|uniref:MMPL family transporter n=1 Tax=Streptomyces johnsoniae TaxID=3075532 RepID=A0ABU2S085_9ACTN|nr:MMPL family transporter [Streptomyces sp. DSM 41886]MDT0442188.1 MMPL family transporter [Streptomyces sp. DSM 41886]